MVAAGRQTPGWHARREQWLRLIGVPLARPTLWVLLAGPWFVAIAPASIRCRVKPAFAPCSARAVDDDFKKAFKAHKGLLVESYTDEALAKVKTIDG